VSVLTSMLTAKKSALTGPVRSALTTNSAMAMVPPGARDVQDVAERGQVVAVAEVGLLQVALDEGETAGEAEAGDGLLCYGNDSRPVDGGDVDAF